jgi:hypothetical protein
VLPLLVTAVTFRLAMTQYQLPALKFTLNAHVYFYSIYALVLFACLTTINRVSYSRNCHSHSCRGSSALVWRSIRRTPCRVVGRLRSVKCMRALKQHDRATS